MIPRQIKSKHDKQLVDLTVDETLLVLDAQLVEKLNSLHTNMRDSQPANSCLPVFTPVKTSEKLTIAQLNERLQQLKRIEEYKLEKVNNQLKDNLKMAIEEYREAILQATLNSFKLQQENEQQQKKDSSKIRLFIFGVLSFLGGVCAVLDGFISSQSLLTVIPNIPNVLYLVTVGFFSLLSGILFFGLEVRSLKEELNISSIKRIKPLLKSYAKQIDLTKQINNVLLKNYTDMSLKDYSAYVEIAKTSHQNLIDKQAKMPSKEGESLSKKILGWSILGFGALLTAGTAFFEAKVGILVVFGIALSSPWGLAISLLSIAIGLAFYYVLEKKGVFKILNPTEKHKQKLNNYKEEYTDFNEVLDKHVKEKQHSADLVATNQQLREENTSLKKQLSVKDSNPAPQGVKAHPQLAETKSANTSPTFWKSRSANSLTHIKSVDKPQLTRKRLSLS